MDAGDAQQAAGCGAGGPWFREADAGCAHLDCPKHGRDPRLSHCMSQLALPALPAALGLQVTPSEADAMVRLLDRDGDGRIDYDEFQRFVVMLPSERGLQEEGLVAEPQS